MPGSYVSVSVSIIREEVMSLQPEISLGDLFILGEENKRELRKARGRARTLLGHQQRFTDCVMRALHYIEIINMVCKKYMCLIFTLLLKLF